MNERKKTPGDVWWIAGSTMLRVAVPEDKRQHVLCVNAVTGAAKLYRAVLY